MERLWVTGAVAALASVLALVLRRHRSDPPTQPSWTIPAQLDRADFVRPEAAWLVVVFSSSTCGSCAELVAKALPLESGAVAVEEVEFVARRSLHERYGIDAVPTVVIADASGVVRRSFVGPVAASDLWAGVAEVREATGPESL